MKNTKYKKIMMIAIVGILVYPSISLASWWNPFTWAIFGGASETKIEKTIVTPSVLQSTSSSTNPTTSTTLTPQQEVDMGKDLKNNLIKYEGYTEDTNQHSKVQAVWAKLAVVAEKIEKTRFGRNSSWRDFGGWELSIMDLKDAGKSHPTRSLMGGIIILDSKFTELPEDQIAFLLAHEMFHAVSNLPDTRATLDGLVELKLGGIWITGGCIIGNIFTPVVGCKPFADAGGVAAKTITILTNKWIDYLDEAARENERSADNFGVQYLSLAGFNVERSLEYLKNQASDEWKLVGYWNDLFSENPSFHSRLEGILIPIPPSQSLNVSLSAKPSSQQNNSSDKPKPQSVQQLSPTTTKERTVSLHYKTGCDQNRNPFVRLKLNVSYENLTSQAISRDNEVLLDEVLFGSFPSVFRDNEVSGNFPSSVGHSYLNGTVEVGKTYNYVIKAEYKDGYSNSAEANVVVPIDICGSVTSPVVPTSSMPGTAIKVISPNGGEEWVIGKTYNITWSTDAGTIDSIFLRHEDHSLKGIYIQKTPVNVGANGFYSWTVPSTLTPGSYKISVVIPSSIPPTNYDVGDDTTLSETILPVDSSDNWFSIVSSYPIPVPVPIPTPAPTGSSSSGGGGSISPTATINTVTTNPILSLGPTSGAKGTRFTFAGSGFKPGGVIQEIITKPDGTRYAPNYLTANTQGNATKTYDSSTASIFGTYSIYWIDQTTGKQSNTVQETISAY